MYSNNFKNHELILVEILGKFESHKLFCKKCNYEFWSYNNFDKEAGHYDEIYFWTKNMDKQISLACEEMIIKSLLE